MQLVQPRWRIIVALFVCGCVAAAVSAQGGSWSTMAPVPLSFGGAGVASVNGKIYVVGGQIGNSMISNVFEYDPSTNAWSSKSPMPIARGALGVAAVNGILYAIGGCTTNDCSGLSAAVQAYDPVTDTWTNRTSAPTPRRSFSAGVINGIIYVAGGFQGPGSPGIASAEAYNPATDSWTELAPMPTARAGVAITASNGLLYAIGGETGVTEFSEVDVYDPGANTWSTKSSLPSGRAAGTAVAIGGLVYHAGGDTTPTGLLGYDPITDSWSSQPSLPNAISPGAEGAIANGIFYVIDFGTNQAFTPGNGTAWRFSGDLNLARSAANNAQLQDGRILITTGDATVGCCTNTAEVYNPNLGEWTLTGPMVIPQAAGGTARLADGRVLVAGGDPGATQSGPTNIAEIFDPGANTWTQTGSMNTQRANLGAVLLPNGNVLVFGGSDADCYCYLNTAEIYNPSTGNWTYTGNMPVNAALQSAAVLPNGKVLVAGGFSNYFAQTSAELYDPNSGTWSPTGSLNVGRNSALTILLNNGKVLVAGGAQPDCTSLTNTAEIYDPISGTWSLTGSMSIARTNFAGALLDDGRVLVSGGFVNNCSAASNTTEIFDPATGTWSAADNLNVGRNQHASFTLPDGRILVAGGFSGSISQDALLSTEIFTPAAPPNNTPTGSGIGVGLDGGSAVAGGATLSFSSVTQAGNTTETVSGTGAPPPAGFKLGTPPTYFDLSTTASYSGPITVCINYGGISFGNQSKLRLFHFENGGWVNVTTTLNTSTMMICGGVTSLSPFGVFEYEYSAAVQAPIAADGSSVFNANRGVVPVKFTATLNGAPTCALPAAMISVFSMIGGGLVTVNQSEYIMPADSGTSFRIDTTSCQYVYNLDAKTLGPGKYTIYISNGDIVIGTAVFALQ